MTGWIEPRGRKYRARWRVDGQLVSVACDTRAQAQAVLDDVATDRRRGTYVDPRGGKITVAEWAEVWIEARPHLKASSAAADKGRMANHVLPHLGSMPLERVTPLVVRRWVAELQGKGLAAKTIRNCHGLLHSLMAAAVDDRLITVNPCLRTGLPRPAPVEMHFLTAVEVERLVAATPEHYRPLVVTLVGTGLRWGEAAGLRRKRLDLFGRKLEVVESLEDLGKPRPIPPKSRASRRVVSLPATVVDVLVPLSVGEPTGMVFTTETGALLRRQNFGRRVWRPAVEKAKLPVSLRVHDLRHTHAAHLISAGHPLTAVQRRLGHASIKVTSDTYGHLLPEADERLLATVDDMLAPRPKTASRRRRAPNLLPGDMTKIVDHAPDLG